MRHATLAKASCADAAAGMCRLLKRTLVGLASAYNEGSQKYDRRNMAIAVAMPRKSTLGYMHATTSSAAELPT